MQIVHFATSSPQQKVKVYPTHTHAKIHIQYICADIKTFLHTDTREVDETCFHRQRVKEANNADILRTCTL